MPGFRAEDAGDGDESDDSESVGVYAVTHEVLVQHDGRADGGEPEQKAEGADMRGSDIDERVHTLRVYRDSAYGVGWWPIGGNPHVFLSMFSRYPIRYADACT